MILQACNSLGLFEKTVAFPSRAWSSSNIPSFQFTITDTTALYYIFAVMRHTDAYHFNNIWLNVRTISPGNTSGIQQVNLKLGDNAKGWLGSAMDDIIEHRILLTKYPVKLKQGNYTFMLQHIMREDPLKNVLNAGIRVEKAVQ